MVLELGGIFVIATEVLVKKFDNIYPVKAIKIPFMKADGTVVYRTECVVDYEEAERIRATMTPAEIERQRSVV